MTDFTDRLRLLIDTRMIDAEHHEAIAQDEFDLARRIRGDMDALKQAIEIIEAATATPEPKQKPKKKRPPRPFARKYPFLDMKLHEEVFIPNKTTRGAGGALSHAKQANGWQFDARSIHRDGVPGLLVIRTK